MAKKYINIGLILVLILCVVFIFKSHFLPFFSLDSLNRYFSTVQGYYFSAPVSVILIYILLYVFSNALPVPVMLVLTLFGGALFGPLIAVPVVLVSATGAAVISALLSRFILRKRIESRYASALKTINDGLRTNGLGFLFSLRLVPVFPFFVVNFLLGLTRIPLYLLAITTFIGLSPSVIIYTFAGRHLTRMHSIHDALSPELIFILLGFAFLAFLPSLIGWIRKPYRRAKS